MGKKNNITGKNVFQIRDDRNYVLREFDNLEDCIKTVKNFEAEDMLDETYTENFYKIYDLTNKKVIDIK